MIQSRFGVSTRHAGLVFFLGLYFMGIGYFLRGAETTTVNPMLYWNRVYLYMLVGGVLLGIYTWINFKPEKISTQQYTYHPWDKEDIPDSMRGNLSWGSGRYINKSSIEKDEKPTEPSREYWKKKREEYLLKNPPMEKTRRYTVSEKISAVIIVAMLVFYVFTSYFTGVQRFVIMAFLAFIGVPLLWIIIREDKSGDRGEINLDPDDLSHIKKDELDVGYRKPTYWHPDVRNYEEELRKKSKT